MGFVTSVTLVETVYEYISISNGFIFINGFRVNLLALSRLLDYLLSNDLHRVFFKINIWLNNTQESNMQCTLFRNIHQWDRNPCCYTLSSSVSPIIKENRIFNFQKVTFVVFMKWMTSVSYCVPLFVLKFAFTKWNLNATK